MKNVLVCLVCIILSSCSLMEINTIETESEIVRLYDSYSQVKDCQFIGEVIGTEGHWYNYLFISNRDLTQGSVNNIKNGARKMGANAVHVHTNMFFTTSVTILGQAYDC